MRVFKLVLPLVQGATMALSKSFDYVIVGAGTSGLVVANRLSEDPAVTVAVIEPGLDQRNNPNVTDMSRFSLAFGTSIDWQYKTTEQPGAGGKKLSLPQGKAWGGSSAINGMTYIRGEAAAIDAWEELGNPGWNWESLFPYYKKSENSTVPSDAQLAAGATYESQYHGFNGHIRTGYPATLANGSFAPVVIQTWEDLSLPHNPDLNSGRLPGFSMGPQTIDGELGLRWDAARAYYYPVEGRPNLKIIQGTVKRITWAPKSRKGLPFGSQPPMVATGVEYLTNDGKTNVLCIRKEVILSAGALRTPLVLEGSGIGNSRRLKSLGIETKVDLPGVGENLIQQPNHILQFSGDGLESSPSAYHTFATAADLFGHDIAAVEATTRASLRKWAEAAADASGGDALNVTALEQRLRIQHDLLFNRNITAAETLTVVAPGGVLASNFWILLPFSRGSVHLGSVERINDPLIDSRLFLADFDLNATLAIGKLTQKFWLSEPMNAFVSDPVFPGPEELPNNATDRQWEAYAREYVSPNGDPLGTASMMSRELGGVVDPELIVYGTLNVRVVDASVLPAQISGHLTATLYAVAERASDIIRRAMV